MKIKKENSAKRKLKFWGNKYSNFISYEGEVLKAKFHGEGSLICSNYKYFGDFVDGLKEGKGKLHFSNDSHYYGSFFQDKRNGSGEFHYPKINSNKKLKYVGMWLNDKRSGEVIKIPFFFFFLILIFDLF